jgi:hypothetical protein
MIRFLLSRRLSVSLIGWSRLGASYVRTRRIGVSYLWIAGVDIPIVVVAGPKLDFSKRRNSMYHGAV